MPNLGPTAENYGAVTSWLDGEPRILKFSCLIGVIILGPLIGCGFSEDIVVLSIDRGKETPLGE